MGLFNKWKAAKNPVSPEKASEGNQENRKQYKILLLTNRDSDNVGDQVIEACDISLIETVMDNLKMSKDQYQIMSRAASLGLANYISKKKPEFLKTAEKAIEKCDLVIFGGAPMFNFHHQIFAERTAVTLELAKKYEKPVIFSAIGIEGYDEKNKKCQQLKRALNAGGVKQITTRDDFEGLKQFREKEDIVIDKVSDPAVFSMKVFEPYLREKPERKKKKIGLFILRAGGFVDNQIDFPSDQAACFWKDLTTQLKEQGYDYELLTSGHGADEAVIDKLIREYGIEAKKCVFNMNDPEKLVSKISSYDAIVSCRLHPSIIAFSLGVPSIGIAWNVKVNGFYESIGYGERVVNPEEMTPDSLIRKISDVLDKGVEQDERYLSSVYETLFRGIKNVVCPEQKDLVPYTYQELLEKIPAYEGTTPKEMEEKLKRKFRRLYKGYNKRSETIRKNKETILELKQEIKRLKDEINSNK